MNVYINVLNAGVFICISLIVLVVVNQIWLRSDKRINEVRGRDNSNKINGKQYIKRMIEKKRYTKFYEKTEIKLMKRGNPLHLNPINYYFIKIAIVLIMLVMMLLEKYSLIISIPVSVAGFFILDFLYYTSDRDDRKKILSDIADINDVLEIQTAAGVNLGISLTELFDIPKSKRLRNGLVELAAEINLTKDVERAIDNFINKFDLIEINSFALSLKQSMKTGKYKEILKNQGELLRKNSLYDIQNKTVDIERQVAFIAMLLLSGTVAMIIYSFAEQISTSITNTIF